MGRSFVGVVWCLSVIAMVGCGRGEDGVEQRESALSATNARILGFETPQADWTIINGGLGTITASTTRSQGAFSLAVNARGYVPIRSRNMSSLGSDVGPLLRFDVRLPPEQPNPFWFGATQAFVTIPSLGVFNAFVGQVELTGFPLSQFKTAEMVLSPDLLSKLRGSYNDLQLTVVLNVPSNATGTYRIDNLRFDGKVTPSVDCVVQYDATHFLAYFGYTNADTTTATIPVGSQNQFTVAPANRGQATIFAPGTKARVFSLTFDGTATTWSLAGRTATASSTTARCPGTPAQNGSLKTITRVIPGGQLPGATALSRTPLPIEIQHPSVQHHGTIGGEGVLAEDLDQPGDLPPPVLALDPPPPPAEDPGLLPQSPTPVVAAQATNTNVGYFPPDPQISVSSSHVIVTDQFIHFYQRNFQADGTETAPTNVADRSQVGIWGTFATDTLKITGWNDTRAIYDSFRNRFVIAVLGYTADTTTPSYTLVAYSNTQDPNDGFTLFAYRGTATEIAQSGDPDGTDYPSIGVSSHGFLETHGVGNSARGYTFTAVVKIEDVLATGGGVTTDLTYYYDLTGPGGNKVQGILQPAVHHSDSQWNFLVSRTGGNQVAVWGLNDNQSSNDMFSTIVTLADFASPLNMTQKGSTQKLATTNLGTAVLKSVYRDGKFYFVTQDAVDWGSIGQQFTSVRLVRLDVSGAPAVPASGDVFIDRTFGSNNGFEDPPESRFYYAWPAVEVNSNGDMVVIYARSGDTIFPEARYTVRLADDPDVRSSRVLKQGETSYLNKCETASGVSRWGDLGGASVDPRDGTSVWVVHEYVADVPVGECSASNYSLWIGKIDPRK
jgi:hypothetical protein